MTIRSSAPRAKSPPGPPATGFFRRYRERRKLAAADAAALIARFGAAAYGEARRRARESRQGRTIDDNRPEGHWDRVRAMIGRTTRRDGLDTATRYSS